MLARALAVRMARIEFQAQHRITKAGARTWGSHGPSANRTPSFISTGK